MEILLKNRKSELDNKDNPDKKGEVWRAGGVREGEGGGGLCV